MRRIVKLAGILIGLFALLAIVAIVCLMVFVSPNRLKPILTQEVMKYTGRQLVIDGDMSWTFFPYLGIKLGHSSLSNSANFSEKTFAEISHITVGIQLMPLFSHRIESSGIVLNGMKLHLIKNKKGEVNWDFPIPKNVPSQPQTTASVSDKQKIMGLAVTNLEVTNTAVDYSDEQTKKYYQAKNVELHAKNIHLSQPFPIDSSFDVTANAPALSGHIALKGNVTLDVPAEKYVCRDLKITANLIQDTKKINASVLGDLIVDRNQQTIQWVNLQAKFQNVLLTGKVNVTGLATHPVTLLHLQLSPFDLKETLQSLGQDVSRIQIAKSMKGDMDITADTDGVKMQGNLALDALLAAKMTLTHIALQAHFQKGVLDLSPLSANLYQGNLTGQTIVNLNSAAPQITLHAKLTNIQAEPLMNDLGGQNQKIKITGLANFEMQVTTSGTESKRLLENLNGVSQFTFKDGSIVGVDLGYLVDSAYSLIKHQPMTATNTNQTHFGMLSGTGVIRGGVINNTDLFSDSPRFATRGAGSIDLVNQKIDYTLQTVIKQRSDQDNAMNLYGITFPILIKGDLNHPTIRLDSSVIVKTVAEQQINKVSHEAQEKLKEQIKKQLPGKAGDVLKDLLGN